jgi:hypothetical protein
MKILLLSLPRTGSTSLYTQLCKEHNALGVFNPFDDTGRTSIPWEYKGNLVVKCGIIYGFTDQERDQRADKFVELAKKFDQVRFLCRRDFHSHIESLAYLQENNEYDKAAYREETFTSTTKYRYKTPSETRLNAAADTIQTLEYILLKVAAKLDGTVEYYEDLFDPKGPGRYRQLKQEGRLL